jgi:hypothetical protein
MLKRKSILLAVGICTIVIASHFLWSWRTARAIPTGSQRSLSASDEFLAHPSADTWRGLVATGRTQHDDLIAVAAFHISLYDAAALQRDLPNSMTRNGHVDEYVTLQEQILKREFGILCTLPSSDLWKLIDILCSQQFDERLVWTGAELAYRMSPARFTNLAKSATGENRRIMDYVPKRFVAGDGHIGDW